MRSLTTVLLVLLVGFTGMLTTAPAASARTEGALLVIMDVSGSMGDRDASRTTLIQGARNAVAALVDKAPADAAIGLRLYGSEYAGNSKATGCTDTRLAVPIGPASSTGPKITKAIDAAKPTGFTPIGYSLTQAAGDFGPEGKRAIVLVSDGEDTCGNPPPCDAAKKLASRGIDVRVDTVGLALDKNAKAREQLECVAKATGGTYVPAADAADLATQLTAVSSRAIQRFRTSGTPITGGPAQIQATPIKPNTTYTDDILNGESRWYSFPVTTGQPIKATVTDDGTKDYGCCLVLKMLDANGGGLGSDNDYSHQTANTLQVNNPEVDKGQTYYLQVQLNDTTSKKKYGALQYQLTVNAGKVIATPSATPTQTPTTSASPSPTATDTASAAPTTEPSTSPDTASSTNTTGGRGALWTVIGILAAAVAALTAALIVSRRRPKLSGS